MSYDLQCYSVKREEKVLAVDVHLATPDNDSVSRGAANPMEDIGYSRFVMTMIDKTSGKTIAPFGNIPAAEISYVKSVKDLALQQKILHPAPTAAQENGGNQGGFTSTFAFGKYRGKTVVDVLLDPAGGLEALLKEREFLAQKAAQYPKNKAMLDEIDRLQAEIHRGNFDPAKHRGSAVSRQGRQITIYEQNYKFLNSRRNAEGNPLVYAIRMTFNQDMNYSWEVTIQNGYAPVHVNAKGGTNIQASEIVDKVQSSMKMNDIEFCSMIDKMHDCYRDFSTCAFRQQYTLAQNRAQEARNRALQTRAQTASQPNGRPEQAVGQRNDGSNRNTTQRQRR